jgi:hypothetical protein
MPRGRPRKVVVVPVDVKVDCGCFYDIEGIHHMCKEHFTPSKVGGEARMRRFDKKS